jgi:hypothetical protein
VSGHLKLATGLRRGHLVLAGVWLILAIPTVLWWHDSVVWVALCSLYANAGLHVSSYMGARAERAACPDKQE